MNRIALNDLPQWSPWPSRLLGLTPWTIPTRDIDKVKREYDQDKFAKLLGFCRERGERATPEDLRRLEMGGDAARRVCISMGDEFFEVSAEESRELYDKLLFETFEPLLRDVRTIVELGAGFGYNLWTLRKKFPQVRYAGGELSENAIAVAKQLYRGIDTLSLRAFNFYDSSSYTLVSGAEPPILVFTSHALSQLPTAAPFLDAMKSCRTAVKAVVHLEPLYDPGAAGLLNQFRTRYTEANDYNRDLKAELLRRSDVTIVSCRDNALGQNPLNPVSVLQWRFA